MHNGRRSENYRIVKLKRVSGEIYYRIKNKKFGNLILNHYWETVEDAQWYMDNMMDQAPVSETHNKRPRE